MRMDVTDAADAADLDRIAQGLAAFNASEVGPSNRRPLAVLLRAAAEGPLEGGLNGYTAWNWLFTQHLWVSEALRGQGAARRLLAAAEDEARARGCHSAWIDTFNPVARALYESVGYQVFGSLPLFVGERTRFFLRRSLYQST